MVQQPHNKWRVINAKLKYRIVNKRKNYTSQPDWDYETQISKKGKFETKNYTRIFHANNIEELEREIKYAYIYKMKAEFKPSEIKEIYNELTVEDIPFGKRVMVDDLIFTLDESEPNKIFFRDTSGFDWEMREESIPVPSETFFNNNKIKQKIAEFIYEYDKE